ncbi:hypothetical protein [uncultured Imperialibacter sp.]|uniref:hypothetical protein n=1 Tax=uncultured Imperialibacter sp. TaxID=1672639 RepID=UPI0030DC4C13
MGDGSGPPALKLRRARKTGERRREEEDRRRKTGDDPCYNFGGRGRREEEDQASVRLVG